MKIFNSNFEVSLRILVLLDNVNKPVSVDYITTVDLFTTYGKNYGFLDINIHGDSSYKFGEIASRRSLVGLALKDLVLKEIVTVHKNTLGFTYQITKIGKQMCSNMNSSYFVKYNEYSKNIIRQTDNMDEIQLVNHATQQSIKRGNYNG